MNTNVRPLESKDIHLITNYWLSCTPEYLKGMGADINKMPTADRFATMLEKQLTLPYESKSAYALIWEIDGKPVGHCNVNAIKYGETANMHLHLWHNQNRKRGTGTILVKKSIPFFFEKLKLQTLVSEPYAENPAPNKTLPKAGFAFVKKYTTIPGSLNFEQEVNRYEMSQAFYNQNYIKNIG